MPLVAHTPSPKLIAIVSKLGGDWHGNVAMCRCPAHADNHPSLSLRQGDRGILVHCFAGCQVEDILRELGRLGAHGPATPPSTAPRPQVGNPHRIWEEGRGVKSTLAEHYLFSRSLPPDLPDLRFHPRCPYLPRPRTVFLPALLVALREGQMLRAIQRIFLDPRTARYTHKRMLGVPGNAAWRSAPATDVLAIAEGFEDAAAFSLLHFIPCWAGMGTERLIQMQIPLSVRTLLIAEDDNGPGRLAAGKAVTHYARPGLQIFRRPPPRGFEDWAEAREAGMR
ncbi:toprim domain-containing protein [Sphingobium sp. EM0848]|uniref:DUF7146 domain-containing protein n=1 Tax=Sphingobium sp. EM0848 TaxID=2743473 RepID=UPI00159C22E3|nr:toprim domain-containing protein [Sphingobium sp. EM0848]